MNSTQELQQIAQKTSAICLIAAPAQAIKHLCIVQRPADGIVWLGQPALMSRAMSRDTIRTKPRNWRR
jgi:hypothetical protein